MATTEGRELRARWIIGADGANSRMRRALPADRTRWYAGLARAVEFHMAREAAPETLRELAEPQLHVGHIRAGYGWVFPGSSTLCVGMCGLEHESGQCRGHFEDFLRQLGIAPDSVDLRGHPLPYGNWLERPSRGRLLLAGDAAGFVEPLLGEGIFYALTSGRMAAEAVAENVLNGTDAHEAYAAALEHSLFPEFRGSDRLRRVLLGSLRLAGYGPFGAFMRLAAGPLAAVVHGRRSWQWMRPKSWEF